MLNYAFAIKALAPSTGSPGAGVVLKDLFQIGERMSVLSKNQSHDTHKRILISLLCRLKQNKTKTNSE